MPKIIQITDTHLVPDGATLFGADPIARLAACVSDINTNHADAAVCVVTGDLTHYGEREAYMLLAETLGELRMPVRLLAGNHDDRSMLRDVFPETPMDPNGFIQSTMDLSGHRLVFMDTTDEGVHSGAYCSARQAWLRAELEAAEGAPCYLFMHHPCFLIQLPQLDQYAQRDSEAIATILADFPNVRHIFAGHVHRPIAGSWRGIPFHTLRGTNHQVWLDFSEQSGSICSLEPPAYAIAFLDQDQTIVHFHDFLDSNPKYSYEPEAPLESQIRELVG
ncbi:3',5'-cyclic AMP phosphodiesterase CpdA [Rhodoligotrophos appendicifer]|uniref:phosphodiesterase n=1 Tax=Rhodoligotrophos appendicifer TaxID=987056 RepID=UPI001180A142|nr:phosphodiesterase [Rhodoligotrophos appendicifer]